MRRWVWIIPVLLFIAMCIVLLSNRESPAPPAIDATPIAPPAADTGEIQRTDQPPRDGDPARAIIAAAKTRGTDGQLDEIYGKAQEFLEAKQFADAHLLLFFCAREGHADSALLLGTMMDPNYHSPDRSLMEKPDPLQALKWYRTAAEKNHAAAKTRLLELRRWAERAANDGDATAQHLLLGWD